MYVYIRFWLHWIFFAVSRLSPAAAHELLIMVNFLVVEHKLWVTWASVVATCGLSSCHAWASLLHSVWDLPGPGIELMFPALAGRFLTIGSPAKS